MATLLKWMLYIFSILWKAFVKPANIHPPGESNNLWQINCKEYGKKKLTINRSSMWQEYACCTTDRQPNLFNDERNKEKKQTNLWMSTFAPVCTNAECNSCANQRVRLNWLIFLGSSGVITFNTTFVFGITFNRMINSLY